MNRYKAKALAEGVICSALSVVLVLIGIFFPSVATLLTMLAGVPMMYLGMRRGIRILVASILVSVLVVFLVTNHLVGSLLTAVMSFLPGMAMGYALRKRFTFSGIIFSGGGILLFGFVFQLALFNAMGDGQGVANMVNQTLDGVRQTTAEVLAGMQGQIPDQGQDLQAILNQTLDMVRDTIFLYLPAFLIGAAVVMSYLLFMLGAFLLNRTRPVRILYQPFWAFCAPRSMCYLAGVLYLIASFSSDSTVWTAALKNILVLLYGYFAVCGMSFIDYKLKKKISSGYGRTAIYFAVFCVGYMFLGMLFQGLCILGMIDGVFGFRIREESVRHE